MTEPIENQDVITFYQKEASHWSFLLVIFVGYFLADQLYSLVDKIAPKIIEGIESFTGEYTYPALIGLFLLIEVKFLSMYLEEINIIHKPQMWVWVSSILILSHPLLVFQNKDNISVDFEIFGIIERTFDGSDELFIFIFSSIIYLFATFGVLQILNLSQKSEKIEDQKLSNIISVDILPIMGIILIFIYFVQSLVGSSFDEIDYSNPVKIIIFIIFSYASIPNVSLETKNKVSPVQE